MALFAIKVLLAFYKMLTNCLLIRTSLQTSASILASNIESLTTLMSNNSELLNKTVVYPSTNYPGRTQEAVLTQLLRKKLEPGVETWVEEARTTQSTIAEAAATNETYGLTFDISY